LPPSGSCKMLAVIFRLPANSYFSETNEKIKNKKK
jgi:hypothetical protein